MEYGLIGKKLGHSFSKLIHEAMTDYTYTLCELPTEDDVAQLLRAREFRGINVTIPYKETVLPLCDVVDESARAIGAVNTIVCENGMLTGYNTDFAGCRWALQKAGICLRGKKVLVLGSGGTQKTFCAVARAEGASQVVCVSRTPRADADGLSWATYDTICAHADAQAVLNATPVGMYPHGGQSPVDLALLPHVEAVFDAIYNPFETHLLWQARQKGCVCVNGLYMLVAQAKYAAEYFLQSKIQIDDCEIVRVAAELRRDLANLVLIGMPGSGKSTLGRSAADLLKKQYVDLDTEIVARAGKPIPAIFAQDGEAAFRDLESALCAEYGAQTGCVLCTGGGAVLRPENVRVLRQNGVVLQITRPQEQLATDGRPLSAGGTAALSHMAQQRAPLYAAAADCVVDNDGTPDAAVRAIVGGFYEIIDSERP